MDDRNVQYPQRYQLVKVEGTDNIYDIIPAPGEITAEGTLINKAALLKDETAELFAGLPENPVPDEVFQILSKAALIGEDGGISTVNGLPIQSIKTEETSYIGTGTSGASGYSSVSFSFAPDIVIAKYYKNPYKTYQVPMFGRDGSSNLYVMYSNVLDTSFKVGYGFGENVLLESTYGKKSADGKTFSWYYGNATKQLNNTGFEYHFVGIKV